MVLEYDFDIVTIEAGESDPNSAPSKGRTVRALFRDAGAAEALQNTSPKIRWMFEDAGFGLDPTDSDVAHGYYRARDAAERQRILRALFANIRDMGVKGEQPGAFDLWKFLSDVKMARPQGEVTREVADLTRMPQFPDSNPPKRQSIQWRIGLALGLAVLVIALLRYLATNGATP